ncbi:hypothetical protein CEXT_292141 [Caerostris extrusa]|uniref:Uncharacterized protein n=1 Tax=Caerostris extrusa TaxID=172846 RepID=A0AAV4SMG5_CAEEX|nr:hypothetical protein CEXT_292141 [Caerostris extrusa]
MLAVACQVTQSIPEEGSEVKRLAKKIYNDSKLCPFFFKEKKEFFSLILTRSGLCNIGASETQIHRIKTAGTLPLSVVCILG